MTVIELDARFPTVIPLEAASLLTGEVSYTEEVPIRVRWAIADAGGHSVSDAEILVTTDPENEEVQDRIERGENLITVGLADAPTPEMVVSQSAAAPAADSTAASGSPSGEVDATDSSGTQAATADERVSAADAGSESAVAVVKQRASTLPHVEEAVAVMAGARRTGEWEASQTHVSLLRYLVEETYEFIDAVNEGGDIRGELSDLLLQVLFHAEVAEDFDLDDVAADFVAKMRARQPYLFDGSIADGEMVSVADQESAWAAGRTEPRSEPALYLPALALAEEAIRRARAIGMTDDQIPVDLMCPTPGLELESGAEERTRKSARAFLQTVIAAEATAAQGATPTDTADADTADVADEV